MIWISPDWNVNEPWPLTVTVLFFQIWISPDWNVNDFQGTLSNGQSIVFEYHQIGM